MDFAVLDDSLRRENGIWVYSHALIVGDLEPDFLVFVNNGKRGLFGHEDEIYDFLADRLYIGCRLYACMHYQMYSKIWDSYFCENLHKKRWPRIVKKKFKEAHNASTNESKRVLEERLKNYHKS